MDIKSSDFILILNLEDIHGQKMRVADTAEFTVRVWTNDPTHYLTFNRRDIISDDYNDRIAIDKMQMECLASGTIIYDYDYARWNADFSATDEKYNKVKTVVTDVYWRNVLNPGNPCNIVNYQTIEHIYDLIEKERVEREKLGYYIENEYTNKLADEVKRSNEVDIEMYKTIKENKEACDSRTTEITTKLDDEIKRSTDADNTMLAKINDNLSSTTEITSDLTNKLNDEIVRAKAKENEIANDLASEIERTNNFKQQIRDAVDQETSRATAKEELIDGKITDEIARAKVVESDITSSLQRLKTSVKTKDEAHDEAINTIDTRLTAEVSRAQAKDNATDNRLSVIEGDSTVIGSIAHSLADAKHYTDEEVGKVKTTVTNEYTNTLKSYATKAEVDSRIEGVIGTAPEALDTLGEIAEKLTSDSDAITAINGVLSGKANSDDVYTKSEIDTKVTTLTNDLATETSRATNAENTLTNDLATEVARAKAKEDEILGKANTTSSELSLETLRAKNAEGEINTTLNTVKGDVERLKTGVQSNTDSIAVINGDAATNGSISHALSDAKHYTDDAVTKVKADLNVSVAGFATKNEVADVKATVSTKADKATTYTKDEVDEKIANFDGNVQLDDYAKTVDVDEKIETVKTNTATELGKKLDKTTYATDKLTFADKTETNNAIKTVSDNLTAEVTRATNAENTLTTELGKKANSADVYNKTQVDEKLSKKTAIKDENGNIINEMIIDNSSTDDSVEVYTKEQCDARFMKMWQGTQSEYDAITSKDNNTLYIIK